MNRIEHGKGRKIHTRSIEISTFEGEDGHIVVEGRLRDDRLVKTYHNISGKERPPQSVHDMILRMCIDCQTLSIEAIEVDMPRVPHDECRETAQRLQELKGMRIVPGITSKIKRLLGGNRGCLHLTTLLLAMAPATLQGFWTYRSKGEESRQLSAELFENYLVDTCWVWRKDGPLANRLLESLPENTHA